MKSIGAVADSITKKAGVAKPVSQRVQQIKSMRGAGHMICRNIGMTEDQRRYWLFANFGVESFTDLPFQRLKEALDMLRDKERAAAPAPAHDRQVPMDERQRRWKLRADIQRHCDTGGYAYPAYPLSIANRTESRPIKHASLDWLDSKTLRRVVSALYSNLKSRGLT